MFPIQQFMSNPQMFKKQFETFAQNFQRNFNGANPQQMVQNLLNNGKMTQEQFNQFRTIANQITGLRL